MRKSKYGNKKVVVDGHAFDSKKEARRYGELKILSKGGVISQLALQPKYEFIHDGYKIGTYKADFRYIENGAVVVEDVKSEITRKKTDYRLRVKMMKAFHKIDILET